ncbi:hypothetical protein [Saccharothrix sp. ALI-22-I]|uniref:hypothetical protein n=1 Tax=Saccharothrix sp. ALI-22-I TaxID=1933778 RepID=UPI0015C2C910|nr:hypothetical protein [Saccharothrix sp. ALI-22-I]
MGEVRGEQIGVVVAGVTEAAADAPDEFVRQVAAAMGADADWRVGLGRPQSGAGRGGAVVRAGQVRVGPR